MSSRRILATRPRVGRGRAVVAGGLIAAAIAAGCAKKEPGTETGAREVPERAAPPIVQEMIAAHGGMATWLTAPTVSFEDEFATPGSPATVSRVTVEQRSRRAYLEFPATNATAGWDGDSCWSKNWSSPLPPRFLMLLNYYFLNLPWLTMDPGVKLGEPGTGRLRNDSTEYATVLMTFEPGTGDTPDDYYRLYIDPATKRLKAYQYVATYQAILPKRVSSSPENTLVFEAYDTVSGLVVPVKYTIYMPDNKILGTCAIRSWSFEHPFDESRLRRVPGAVTDTSTP